MKTIGLIGGMSWESTKHYYELINEKIKEELGGLHSAECILYSVDFEVIKELQFAGEWEKAGEILSATAIKLENAGADFIILCTNTMHISADAIQQKITIPFLHIADPTAYQIKSEAKKTIGLLGTNFTMEEDFYKGRLTQKHGLEVIIPEEDDRKEIHRIIYDELCLGDIKLESKEKYKNIISKMAEKGAEGIILGCTEIGMLIKPEDVTLPLYDTTALHAFYAVKKALTE